MTDELNRPQIDPSQPPMTKGRGAKGVGHHNFWSIVLDDHWSKKIYKPKMIVWSGAIIHPSMILFAPKHPRFGQKALDYGSNPPAFIDLDKIYRVIFDVSSYR